MSRNHELVGRRVKVTGILPKDPAPLEIGDTGTVGYVDDGGTLFVQWDSGRQLGLLPGDPFVLLADERNEK